MAILMVTFKINAQEFVSSDVRLSKEAIGKTTSVVSENAVIRLNNQNDEFVFSIRLFPILTSTNENDSITSLNQKMVVDYKAIFPIDDLDFFDAGNEGKRYTLYGDLTVNNITKPLQLDFYLQQYIAPDISIQDIQIYPVRISFAFEINPAEFGLDNETAKFTEKIIVVVGNGIINKSTGSF